MADLRTLLTALKQQNDGQLTPQCVVDAARPVDHPLHSRFEWDDAVAGERYRRHQARELIRSVRVEHVDPTVPEEDRPRYFHAVTRADGHSYASIEEIVADPELQKRVLLQAEVEWRSLHRKYKHLDAFLSMVRDAVSV